MGARDPAAGKPDVMTPPAKMPPPGVETEPQGPVVPVRQAAARLNKHPRTLIEAIKAGKLRGGALPRPERLRWYVYEDELPPAPAPPSPTPVSGAEIDELRAQLVTQTEVNRLLLAAQQNLAAAEEGYRDLSERYREVSENYRLAAQQYQDALAQFLTPGHLGDLTR